MDVSAENWRIRSGPSENHTIILTVSESEQRMVYILGRYLGWRYVQYDTSDINSTGWIDRNGLTAITPNCDVLFVDASGNPMDGQFDYVLPEPPANFLDGLTCTDVGSESNWIQCSKFVYVEYYTLFQTERGRLPMMSDLLAGVFWNELGIAYTGDIPPRQGVTSSTAQLSEQALANNYWNVVGENNPGCNTNETCRLDVYEISEKYLLQVQSFYSLANLGRPLSLDITRDYVNSLAYKNIALDTLSQGASGCTNGEPCSWGNYGYDDPDYQLALNESATTLPYCHRHRGFTEGDGNPATAIHVANDKSTDQWDDSIFVLATVRSYGTTSTYQYGSDPAWVHDNTVVGFDRDSNPIYLRNTLGPHTRGTIDKC